MQGTTALIALKLVEMRPGSCASQIPAAPSASNLIRAGVELCGQNCLSEQSAVGAESEDAWQELLTTWQTEADIQEAERALYALPWSFNSSLLQQTLNLTFTDDDVVSRSPANIASALLKNVGSNSLGVNSSLHGSDVAWAWIQDNFAAVNSSS